MKRKITGFWVVFYRVPRGRTWRPTSVHRSAAAAKVAFWEQVNDGPPGGHRIHKFYMPALTKGKP